MLTTFSKVFYHIFLYIIAVINYLKKKSNFIEIPSENKLKNTKKLINKIDNKVILIIWI